MENKSIFLIKDWFVGLSYFLKKNKESRLTSAEKPKIIILKGLFSSHREYHKIKKSLEKEGYEILLPLPKYKKEISLLNHQLEIFVKRKNLKNFIILGHSFGGVLGLYYFKKHHKNIDKLICLGSPFHGTNSAYFMLYSKLARSLLPKSKFIKSLNKKIPQKNKIYSLASKYDLIVPISSSKIKGSNFIEIKKTSHQGLIFNTKVLTAIKKIIQK